MNQSNVIVRVKLIVFYWDLILMESGAELSALLDMATVRFVEGIPAANKQGNYWWTE